MWLAGYLSRRCLSILGIFRNIRKSIIIIYHYLRSSSNFISIFSCWRITMGFVTLGSRDLLSVDIFSREIPSTSTTTPWQPRIRICCGSISRRAKALTPSFKSGHSMAEIFHSFQCTLRTRRFFSLHLLVIWWRR